MKINEIMTQQEIRTARAVGGWRERYAMENGEPSMCHINGVKCVRFACDTERDYQDANGAIYCPSLRIWIG